MDAYRYPQSEDDATNNVYAFSEFVCRKMAGPGVAKLSANARKDQHARAKNTAICHFLMFESDNNDEVEPLWVARVVTNTAPDWKDKGVWKNNQRHTIKYDSKAEVQRNEYAIFVMWYERIDINSDVLGYRISRTHTKPNVQSNRYLVHASFSMHRVLGRSNPVPKLRSSRNDTARQNNQRRANAWYDKEYGLVWNMDARVRQEALSKCGLN